MTHTRLTRALSRMLALAALGAMLSLMGCALPPPPPSNACGGDVVLGAIPGTLCSLGSPQEPQSGVWRCDRLGGVVCANACGGDATLTELPDTPCERDGLSGVYTCNLADPSGNTVSCATFNACGGDQPLNAEPGAACTTTDDSGEQTTTREGIVICDRNDPLNNTTLCGNMCGGTQALPHNPGDPCGCEDAPNLTDLSADQGVYSCNGTDQVVCRASAEAANVCVQGDLPDCYGPTCATPYDAIFEACAELDPSAPRSLEYDGVEDQFLCVPESVPHTTSVNACGGTALALNTSPATAACASVRSSCNAPGTPCSILGDPNAPDGIWVCSDADTLTCVPIFNADRSPRPLCEAIYDALPGLPEGSTFVSMVPCEGFNPTNDGRVVHCSRRADNVAQNCTALDVDRLNRVNLCGGTSAGLFSNATGDAECGCGGSWACSDPVPGTVPVCINQALNACGGCEPLAIPPGTPCATQEGLGATVCDGPNATTCALNAQDRFNACGGSVTISSPLIPGTPCGPCKDGRVACISPNQVACLGATELNACGGCGILPGREGQDCAPRHAWSCLANAMVCEPVTLGGGGVCNNYAITETLDGEPTTGVEDPGAPCQSDANGEDGVFVCDSGQHLICITAPP